MFDLIYFIGESYFNDDGLQNYLIFQPVFKYYTIVFLQNFLICIIPKQL